MGKSDLFQKRRQGRKKRRHEYREPRANSFLIVTEGKCTEPSYFKGMKKIIQERIGGMINIVEVPLIEIRGQGRSTGKLIDITEQIVKKAKIMYQNVWVVFDKDDFTYANNNEKATLTKTYTVEGKYEVVAKDKFGHKKTYTFVIDKTAPKRTSANILEYNADNNLRTYYVTKGDIIHAYVSFDEPLAENPSFVFINDGKEYAPPEAFLD